MMKPAAFLFDMDGLLLDTERVFMDLSIELTADYGIGAEDARSFFLSLIGSSGATTRQRLAEFLPGQHNGDALYAKWSTALSSRLADHVPLRPHVPEVLETLHKQGARMAVVTSTRGASARHHLHVAGLFGYFETVIGGDEVTANKPDPAPYAEAAQALGVDPAHCAAFEDSDAGITSAVRAGCRAVQIPDLRPPNVPLPDLGQHVAPDLRAALRHFRMI